VKVAKKQASFNSIFNFQFDLLVI